MNNLRLMKEDAGYDSYDVRENGKRVNVIKIARNQPCKWYLRVPGFNLGTLFVNLVYALDREERVTVEKDIPMTYTIQKIAKSETILEDIYVVTSRVNVLSSRCGGQYFAIEFSFIPHKNDHLSAAKVFSSNLDVTSKVHRKRKIPEDEEDQNDRFTKRIRNDQIYLMLEKLIKEITFLKQRVDDISISPLGGLSPEGEENLHPTHRGLSILENLVFQFREKGEYGTEWLRNQIESLNSESLSFLQNIGYICATSRGENLIEGTRGENFLEGVEMEFDYNNHPSGL